MGVKEIIDLGYHFHIDEKSDPKGLRNLIQNHITGPCQLPPKSQVSTLLSQSRKELKFIKIKIDSHCTHQTIEDQRSKSGQQQLKCDIHSDTKWKGR